MKVLTARRIKPPQARMCPAQPRAVADARHRHLHIARQIARQSDSAGSGVGVAPLPDHPGNKFFENLARAIQLCGGSNYGTISGRAPEGGICSWHLFAYSTGPPLPELLHRLFDHGLEV